MKRKHYFYDFYVRRLESPFFRIILFLIVTSVFFAIYYQIFMGSIPYDDINAKYAEIQMEYDTIKETVETVKTTKNVDFILANQVPDCDIQINDENIMLRFEVLGLGDANHAYEVKLDKQYNVISDSNVITKKTYVRLQEFDYLLSSITVGLVTSFMITIVIILFVTMAAGISKKKRDKAYYYN